MSTVAFAERVQAVIEEMGTGVMDRFAANDVLLDLLGSARTEEESARVLKALSELPKSNMVDRSDVAGLLARICAHTN
jgi:hypothetical protein